VGHANGRNPISILVPCHRVIGADGKLTGYGGGLDKKEWLLAWERGATAAGHDDLVDAGSMVHAPTRHASRG
jgi:alkylated DNA nucleotide flippase Atl1